MSKRSETHTTPFEVSVGLRELGAYLSTARRARKDTQRIAGERCGLHPQTIARIERGDPTVAIGKVLALLHIYGQTERIFDLARMDPATEILMNFHLPKRGAGPKVTRRSDEPPSPALVG